MGQKVLVIDDDEQDRKGIALALKREGYEEVLLAANEMEGLELVKTFQPDAVIIDVILAQQDGFDVCRAIKNSSPAQTKVIIITGHLEAIRAAKARVSGADEILEKTAGFKDIHRTIVRLFAEGGT